MRGILARSDGFWEVPVPSLSVTYRDENDALRAKVAELEGELEASRAKVAELSGTGPRAGGTDGETVEAATSLGVPSSIRQQVTLDFVIAPAGYEAIATLLRDRLRVPSSQVGQTLATANDSFRLEVRDGRTVVTLRQDFSDGVRGAWVLTLLPAAFIGIVTSALIHDIGHVGDAAAFANMLWAVPAAGLGLSALVRPYVRRRVEEELQKQRGTFAAVLEAARAHRVAPPKVRVESAVDEALEDPAEDADEADRAALR